MSWSYRVVRTTHANDETSFDVREYYEPEYDPESPEQRGSITASACSPHGETLDELREDLDAMLRALKHPLLDREDF
jgi:hypothetical protein